MPRASSPCSGCGKPMTTGPGSLPAGQRTCRPCRKIQPRPYGARTPGAAAASKGAPCRACGSTFASTRRPTGGSRRTTCSDVCAQRLRTAGKRVRTGGTCPCGVATLGAATFCDNCREERRRAHWRQKNVQRRARYRGTPIGKPARVMSIQELGRRDGWRCHLCHKNVRPSLRHPDPGAPTFDHLIPVSCGGEDVPENLRLAHFRCNSSRGNGGTVQLMLVG